MGFSNIITKIKDNSASNVYTSSAEGPGEDVANADAHLRRVKDQHKWDPFMDIHTIDDIDNAIGTGDAEKEVAVEQSILEEDSPYFEVRASVRL
jgi:hypothetical protein